MPSRSPVTRHRPPIVRCLPKNSARPASCRRRSGFRSGSSTSTTFWRISIRRSSRHARNPGGSRRLTWWGQMTVRFDNSGSSAGAARQRTSGDAVIEIGLVNNVSDAALEATERQFTALLKRARQIFRSGFAAFRWPASGGRRRRRSHEGPLLEYRGTLPNQGGWLDCHRRRAGGAVASRRDLTGRL